MKKEVVILVGMPGCGKTHYCRTALPDHVRLSQDEGPHHFESMLARCRQLLEAGAERIVIDRTNPMAGQRAQFIAAARQHGHRTKIIHFDVPRQLCEQRIRDRTGHPTLGAKSMDQAIDRYLAMLNAPREEECDELVVLHAGPEDQTQ
jgi:predicted kinase